MRTSTNEFRRIHFSSSPENGLNDHWSFGGAPPLGSLPAKIADSTLYFLTLEKNGKYVSVYLDFNYEKKGFGNPFYTGNTMFDEDNSMVQFVVHDQVLKREDRVLNTPFPSAFMVLGSGSEADGPYDDEAGYPFHKTGGIPVFNKSFDSGIEESSKAVLNSHEHLLQVAFPVGPNDCVMDLDWPFGEAIFHVFSKVENGNMCFKYCWG